MNAMQQRTAGQHGFRLAVAVAALLIGAPAVAQSTQGFEAGNLRVRVGADANLGYDSNVFYDDTADEDPESSMLIRLIPSVQLRTIEPRSTDVRSRIRFAWEQYLQTPEGGQDQSGADVDASLGVRINPLGTVSIRPADTLSRSNEPGGNAAAEPLQRIGNEASLEIAFHPGGIQRTSRLGFSGDVRAYHRLVRYEDLEGLNRDTIGGRLQVRYNFLPKSLVFTEVSVESTSYEQATSGNVGGGSLENTSSTPVRASVGYSGLLARKLILLASAGYGAGLYDGGDSPSGPLATLNLTYAFTPSKSLTLGYTRDFSDSAFGRYVTFDRVALRGSARFASHSVTGGFYFQQNTYGTPQPTGGLTEQELTRVFSTLDRSDPIVGANFRYGVSFAKYLRVGAEYRLDANLTDFQSQQVNTDDDGNITPIDGTVNPASYLKHRAFLVFGVMY